MRFISCRHQVEHPQLTQFLHRLTAVHATTMQVLLSPPPQHSCAQPPIVTLLSNPTSSYPTAKPTAACSTTWPSSWRPTPDPNPRMHPSQPPSPTLHRLSLLLPPLPPPSIKCTLLSLLPSPSPCTFTHGSAPSLPVRACSRARGSKRRVCAALLPPLLCLLTCNTLLLVPLFLRIAPAKLLTDSSNNSNRGWYGARGSSVCCK